MKKIISVIMIAILAIAIFDSNVQSIKADSTPKITAEAAKLIDLKVAASDIELVENQQLNASLLPTIYAVYQDGKEEVVTDYNVSCNWKEQKLYIQYKDINKTVDVKVIKQKIRKIAVTASYSSIYSNATISKKKLTVKAYYTNGASFQVTDYEILPYKLIAGKKTKITVKYKNKKAAFTVIVKKGKKKAKVSSGSSIKAKIKININSKKTYNKAVKIKASYKKGIKSIVVTGSSVLGLSYDIKVKNGCTWDTEGTFSVIVTGKDGKVSVSKLKMLKPVKKIKIISSIGKTVKFKAKVYGTERKVKWYTSNQSIATINKSGILTPRKSGICYVYAKVGKKQSKKKINIIITKKQTNVFVY